MVNTLSALDSMVFKGLVICAQIWFSSHSTPVSINGKGEKNLSIHFDCFQSPSTIGEEKQYNPFLRSHDQTLQNLLGVDPEQPDTPRNTRRQVTLAKCRAAKDKFKYKL